jgi:hypothetical protein
MPDIAPLPKGRSSYVANASTEWLLLHEGDQIEHVPSAKELDQCFSLDRIPKSAFFLVASDWIPVSRFAIDRCVARKLGGISESLKPEQLVEAIALAMYRRTQGAAA